MDECRPTAPYCIEVRGCLLSCLMYILVNPVLVKYGNPHAISALSRHLSHPLLSHTREYENDPAARRDSLFVLHGIAILGLATAPCSTPNVLERRSFLDVQWRAFFSSKIV